MSLADVRKKTAEKMAATVAQQCSDCQAPTAWETLSNRGARCQRCFDRFCREPIAGRVKALPAGLKLVKDDPLNSVRRLLARRADGEPLGKAQREFMAAWDRKQARRGVAA